MFTEEQKTMLAAKLDGSNVKSRTQAGRSLSYLEAWKAIEEANRIFGFDGWSRETVYCKEVCRYETTSSSGGTNIKVGYEAKVLVRVGDVVREGTGHGNGTMRDVYDAIESAAKEAESDAMKRALMTFGNQFGLALYDKTQENVDKNSVKTAIKAPAFVSTVHAPTGAAAPPQIGPFTPQQATNNVSLDVLRDRYNAILAAIATCHTEVALDRVMKLQSKTIEDIKATSEDGYNKIMETSMRRRDVLRGAA
jgi:DNA recombination protein Rad52